MQLSLTYKKVLKAAAFAFLIVNGLVTFLLRTSFSDQFDGDTDSDPMSEQKSQLIVLGNFTLLMWLVYVMRGVTIEGCCKCSSFVGGIYTICIGYLVSAIHFFVMSSTICDKDCAEDLGKEAVEKYPLSLVLRLKYVEDELADKANLLRSSSTVAGLGLFAAFVGYALIYHTAWNKSSKLHGLATLPVYFGLVLAALGFVGAFQWYAAVLQDIADGKVVSNDDVDSAKDSTLGFLVAAGLGFILAGVGEGASIIFLVDDEASAEPQPETVAVQYTQKETEGRYTSAV